MYESMENDWQSLLGNSSYDNSLWAVGSSFMIHSLSSLLVKDVREELLMELNLIHLIVIGFMSQGGGSMPVANVSFGCSLSSFAWV